MNRFFIFLFACIVSLLSLKGQCIDTKMFDIYTPAGSPVSTWVIACEERTVEERKARDDFWEAFYENRIETINVYDNVSTTSKFNCHGYAWIRVEQGIDRWIGYRTDQEEEEAEHIYMMDGSYVEVPEGTYPAKVYWPHEVDHSGVTTEVPGILISKWASGPLCRHHKDDCPYVYETRDLKYYAKNCNLNFTDKTVTTGATVTSCGDINVQDVNVQNGSKLILDAVNETTINGNFEVQAGSELEIK